MNRDLVDREWLWNSTAIYVMLAIFVAVGMTTVEVPMQWWMKVLSSVVVGTWLPHWFYDRLTPAGETLDGLGFAARFAVFFLAAGTALALSVENHPFSHFGLMIGLAALQAMNRGFKSVADILGTGAVFLAVLAALA